MRYTKEQYKKQYSVLPPVIKDFMAKEETIEKILDIGKKYNLHIDQLQILNEEVGLVLHGLEKPGNFINNLRKYLGLSEDIANLITYDLNQQIFAEIRGELEKLSSSPQQMFDQKMGGVMNVPKQEVEVKTQTGDNTVEGTVVKPARDPYREPIL
jgi:hypothetical protein